MIKLTIIGNLGQDAKVLDAQNGRKAITFSIAENEKWTDREGIKHEKTTWTNCTIWRSEGQSLEIAKYLKKGTMVYVEGKPEAKLYNTSDGQPAIDNRCQVATIQLLGGKKDDEAPQQTAALEPAQQKPSSKKVPAPAAQSPLPDYPESMVTNDEPPY